MTPAAYSMAQAAARCGRSRERFRKVWPTWVKTLAFPAPHLRPPDSDYAWDKAAVDAWVERRTSALATPTADPEPANDARGEARTAHVRAVQLHQQRRRLAALMHGAV